jgi:hypothetical protein
VKQYDVSAINVEITLNMWLDFYPGYMYVLTENIDKVRAEETKNREDARDVEGYNPGAVMNGLQNQWIQPLTFAATRAIASSSRFAIKLRGGRGQSQHSRLQHGGERPRASRRHHELRQHRPPRESGEFEWYIHPSTAGR